MSFETIYHGNLSRIIRINEFTYLRLGNLPIRDQCNVGIILTNAGIVLIDLPEQHPDDELLSEIEKLFQMKVTHIFFTHAHGDHRNGLSTLVRKDILLLASPTGVQELLNCYPKLQNPVQKLNDGEKITIGNICFSIQIPHQLPAHSPWDMLIGCESSNLIFTGDFLNPPDTLYFHSSNYLNWTSEMKKLLQQTKWDYFILGHGLPWTGTECNLSLTYLSYLSELFTVLRKKGFLLTDHTSYEEIKAAVSELKDAFAFWERTDTVSHLPRHLTEIQHSMG